MNANTAIKIREQFKGKTAKEIPFFYKKTQLIKSVLMYNALLLVLAISSGGLLKDRPLGLLIGIWSILTISIALINLHFFKKIKENNAILILDKKGIQISTKPFLTWSDIISIQVIYHRGHNSNAHQYYLNIRAKDFKWQMNINKIDMEMDEICHWIAYFKKQQN